MQPIKSVCRQAHDGIVNHGSNQESMFYYFIPRLNCHGKLMIHNQSIDVIGHSWYDHEFGGYIKCQTQSIQSLDEPQNTAWYWFSIQLDNQYDLTFTYLFNPNDHSVLDKSAIIIGPNNERLEYQDEDQIELEPLNKWFSARTGCIYSTKWKMIIPKL
jgi:predicted secreted hydrolase